MKQTILVLAVLVTVVVLIVGFFLYPHIISGQKGNAAPADLGTYGYRCGDGTEFTMTPASDMSSITLTPATSVERIPKATLLKVEGTTTAAYRGSGITFTAHGETVQLATSAFTTTCHPMQFPDEAPFNFGD